MLSGPAGRAAGRGGRCSSGTVVGRPSSSSVITRPVAGESWMPARKWPAATKRLSQPGTAPRKGRPSGLPGRRPAQQRSSGASASDGHQRGGEGAAGRRCRRRSAGRRSRRPPRSSRPAPGRRRAARGSACRAAGRARTPGVPVLSRAIWPRTGRMPGRQPTCSSSGSVQAPAASR